MLAGVGPVRLVLFVVAANEGWRRQSEEHLAIVDVLGIEGGVIALTKRDLVDDDDARACRGGGPRAGRRHGPRRCRGDPRVGDDRTGSRRPPGGARPHAGDRAGSRGDADPVVRRSRVHDLGGGHGGHRHPGRWGARGRGRGGALPAREERPHPVAPDPQTERGPCGPGGAGRGQSRGNGQGGPRSRRRPGGPGGMEADHDLRWHPPAGPRPRAPDHRAWRLQGLRRRLGGGCDHSDLRRSVP